MGPELYQRLGTAHDVVAIVHSHSRDTTMTGDSGFKLETACFSKTDGITWSGNMVIKKLLHIQHSLVLGKGRLVLGGLR